MVSCGKGTLFPSRTSGHPLLITKLPTGIQAETGETAAEHLGNDPRESGMAGPEINKKGGKELPFVSGVGHM